MIEQVTVFLENEEGHLAQLCRAIGNAGINMHTLTIADTTDFGIVRIIADKPHTCAEALNKAGYRASVTKVSAIALNDTPGSLADLLELFDEQNINVRYGYCMSMQNGRVIDILKISGAEEASKAIAIKEAGFTIMSPEDVYVLD